MWSLISQGKSSSFTGLPLDLFVEESRKSAFKSGEQWEVLRRKEGAVIVGKKGVEKQLPLDQTRRFSVFEREKITLAVGDRIRFTKNVKHRGQKFLNNELRNSCDQSRQPGERGPILCHDVACEVGYACPY
jgi:hypothetical protein